MAYRRCLSIRAALLARRSNPSFCYISHEDDHVFDLDFSKRKEMAYRRSISVRVALFARRSSPSFGYFSRENDRDKPIEFQSNIEDYVTQRRSLGSNVKSSSWPYCGSVFREGSGFVGGGLRMNRYMSTSTGDIATVLTDAPTEAVASQVPAMSEVAIAAADSAFPVAALQYFIDGVHSFTGLNWWASIALTTVLFRGATIPFAIYEYKMNAKTRLMISDPLSDLEALKTADPSALSEVLTKWHPLVKDLLHRGFLFWWFGLHSSFLTGFYLAITNMAEKVPSFENGGAFWFTDLTTPDATCVLPTLAALTYLGISKPDVLKDSAKPSEGTQYIYFTIGIALFSAAALSFMNFPQALYCHWIASNVFRCCFVYCLNLPGVKKALGFPEKPMPGQGRKP